MNTYETHITVDCGGVAELQSLRTWAGERGLKCVHIVLDRGRTASQPMLTRWDHGQLSNQLAIASEINHALTALGFRVTRIKIETALENPNVPRSSEEALTSSPNHYFEHHIKLLLAPNADTTVLAKIAPLHGAHLSRNALKQREDGYQERFLTQRCTSVGSTEARQQLNVLLQDIAPLGHPILDIEEEFVVYDSNLELDAGWISESRHEE